MGRVAEVLVRVGDEVRSGQLLMKIEGRDYLAGFQEAKAARNWPCSINKRSQISSALRVKTRCRH